MDAGKSRVQVLFLATLALSEVTVEGVDPGK